MVSRASQLTGPQERLGGNSKHPVSTCLSLRTKADAPCSTKPSCQCPVIIAARGASPCALTDLYGSVMTAPCLCIDRVYTMSRSVSVYTTLQGLTEY